MEEVKFKGTKTCYELEDKQGRVGIFTEEYIKEAVAKCEMKIPDELAKLLSIDNKSEIVKQVINSNQVVSSSDVITKKSIDAEIPMNKSIEKAINNCERFLKLKTVVNKVDTSLGEGVYLIPYKENTYILYISDKVKEVKWSNIDSHGAVDFGYLWSLRERFRIEKLIVVGGRNLVTCVGMFIFCDFLQQIDLSNFDTSKVTDMTYMFADCGDLEQLDVSHFDTSNVTDMTGMFDGCKSLQQLDLSHFDTSKVRNANYMFYDCKNLQNLDLSHFDISNIVHASEIFDGCEYIDTFKGIERFESFN